MSSSVGIRQAESVCLPTGLICWVRPDWGVMGRGWIWRGSNFSVLFSSDRCCVNPVRVLEHMLRQARESRKQLSACPISAQQQLDTRESYRSRPYARTHTQSAERDSGNTAEPHTHTRSTERYRVEHIASCATQPRVLPGWIHVLSESFIQPISHTTEWQRQECVRAAEARSHA